MIKFTPIAALLAASLNFGAAQAQEVYGKLGVLGAGVGYAHGLSPSVTLRADFSTIGSIGHDGNSGDFDYEAKIRNNVGTAYVDYFPFEGNFRVTAGLGLRDTRVTAHGRPNIAGFVDIGDAVDIPLGPDDRADAEVEFPSVAPYLGLGWGHNAGRAAEPGWSFFADVGLYIGRPKTSFSVSDSVRASLTAAGYDADAEIQKQRDEIHDEAKKFAVFPSVYVGVAYRF